MNKTLLDLCVSSNSDFRSLNATRHHTRNGFQKGFSEYRKRLFQKFSIFEKPNFYQVERCYESSVPYASEHTFNQAKANALKVTSNFYAHNLNFNTIDVPLWYKEYYLKGYISIYIYPELLLLNHSLLEFPYCVCGEIQFRLFPPSAAQSEHLNLFCNTLDK